MQDSLDRFLLIGDVEGEQQQDNVARYDVEIDVVNYDHRFLGVGMRERSNRLDDVARGRRRLFVSSAMNSIILLVV